MSVRVSAIDTFLAALDRHGSRWKSAGGQYSAQCPAHDDHTASLTAKSVDSKVLIWCHAGCDRHAILDALGLSDTDLFDKADNSTAGQPVIVATYDYVDADGTLLFQKLRYHPKDFRVRVPDGHGGWIWRIGDTKRVLYNLPAVLRAAAEGKTVYNCEGERDADRLIREGYVATCNFDGAAKAGTRPKWRPEYSESLRGAHVVVVADNDEAGFEHARCAARSLAGKAASVRIVRGVLLDDKSDISDHLDLGFTMDDVVEVPLVVADPVTAPQPRATSSSVEHGLAVPTASESITQSDKDEWHLACLLLSIPGRGSLGEVLGSLDPWDFFDRTLGHIWGLAQLVHANGQQVTKRTLCAAAASADTNYAKPPWASSDHRMPVPSVRTVRTWLDRVFGEQVCLDQTPVSVRTVRDTAKMRRLIQAAERIKHRAAIAGDYSQALGAAWEELRGLEASDAPAEAVTFTDLVDGFHKTMAEGLSVEGVISTPWPELNDLLSGGLRPGHSYVIAGRPSAGKSIAGLNVAASAAEQGYPTLVVSQEMSNFELTGRLLASGGHAEYGEIVRYAMSEDTVRRVTEYGEAHRGMPLRVIDQPGMTIEHVGALARTMKQSTGMDLGVIDYLQLLTPTRRLRVREEEVAHISRSIKLLSKELNCVMLTLAQLNRNNVRENRRPALTDMRESDAIAADVDGAFLLHHEQADDGTPTGMVTLIVAKNRFGRTGEVELRWRGHQARIGD